jgi:hypothetical protein
LILMKREIMKYLIEPGRKLIDNKDSIKIPV